MKVISVKLAHFGPMASKRNVLSGCRMMCTEHCSAYQHVSMLDTVVEE